MIRTRDEQLKDEGIDPYPPPYQIDYARTVLRSGNDDLALKILKAEPLHTVTLAEIVTETDRELVDPWPYAGRIVSVPVQQKTIIKVGYITDLDWLRRRFEGAEPFYTAEYRFGHYGVDYNLGTDDTRYHIFAAKNINCFAKHKDDKFYEFIVLFEDIETRRTLIFKSYVLKVHNNG